VDKVVSADRRALIESKIMKVMKKERKLFEKELIDEVVKIMQFAS